MTNKDKAKVICIIGGAFGDEGKGKVSAYYAKDASLVIRATGGANAGHTIYINGYKFATHLIPSGVVYPQTTCLIGQGVVLDIPQMIDEMEGLMALGLKNVQDRIKISSTATILMPFHKKLDVLYESFKSSKVGTTGRGIGPAYMDKKSRTAIKVYDLLLPEEELAMKIAAQVTPHNALFKDFCMYDAVVNANDLAKEYSEYGKKIESMIVDGHTFVRGFVNNPNNLIVVEGAQSVRLSIENGDYPNVTSSDSSTLGTLSGSHLSHKDVSEVITIFKAHFSRVGNGPFPTEFESHIDDEGKLNPYDEKDAMEGDILRDLAGEYGATTKRPRRTGAFDAILAKQSNEIAGADYMCINHIDTLGKFGEMQGVIKLGIQYLYRNEIIDFYPSDMELTLEEPVPEYLRFEGGWNITPEMKNYEDLPLKARLFIETIEKVTGTPVKYLGIGPKNEDLIVRDI